MIASVTYFNPTSTSGSDGYINYKMSGGDSGSVFFNVRIQRIEKAVERILEMISLMMFTNCCKMPEKM